MRMVLTDCAGFTARQVATRLAELGHEVEALSSRPLCLSRFTGHVVKFAGPFVWHQHAQEDELFLVIRGSFTMEFRDRAVKLGAGELIIVRRGIEHRPVADSEVEVLLFEPASTVNTGEVRDALTVDEPEWI
jgi:mannose-6-phosphate isomerase-like protein (cupin superfamily)